jgi:hypothetical protein
MNIKTLIFNWVSKKLRLLSDWLVRERPRTIENDLIVCTDIDDTLVIWNNVKWWEPGPGLVEFHDPTDSSRVYLKPHTAHIHLLRKYKAQGYTIIAWSAGGHRWARSVINTLGLDDIVDIRMSKPLKYMDDLKGPDGILGSRVYIPFEQVNKVIEPALDDVE